MPASKSQAPGAYTITLPQHRTTMHMHNKTNMTGRSTMNGKAVLRRKARTVLTLKSKAFQEKGLCDGITLNLGDACAFSCTYCYVGCAMHKLLHGLLAAASEETN
jgi:hypothetical protein